MRVGITKDDYVRLAAVRNLIFRFQRFSKEAAARAGISPQQHQLLLGIKGHPGKNWATITEVAEHLQVNHNAAVGLVDRGEKAGLVERIQHPDDMRTVQVHLTAKGDELLQHLAEEHRHELEKIAPTLIEQLRVLV